MLYFGVIFEIVVWLVKGMFFSLLLKNLINLLIIFFWCNICVIFNVMFVVVVLFGSVLVNFILIILGIGKYEGCLSIFVFVLILLMFYLRMLILLIIVVCEFVLINEFGYVIKLFLVFFIVWIIGVKYLRFIWCIIFVVGGIVW